MTDVARLGTEVLEAVIATAVRAPSIHNTQPWRFRATGPVIELYADWSRRLPVADPAGRELLISCGAALLGLRLAVREAGFRPWVELLPRWPRLDLVARVHLGGPVAAGEGERRLAAAIRRRHNHRGPFAAEPLPAGLLAALRRDAEAEGAALVLVDADRVRRLGTLIVGVPGAALTAVLLTVADGPADWLRAGQALHRVLLRAAGAWVFGSLHTQPLEVPGTRAALRRLLGVSGAPQILMQLGRAHTAPLTWRRPVSDVLAAG